MLFDDINAMTQAAGPVKLTFYCPLAGQLDGGECDEYIDVGSSFLTAYQDQIEQGIADEQAPEMGDVAQYIGGNPGVAAKLMSAVWMVEEMDGRLLGRINCHLKEPLTPEEMSDLREEILGQCSDGLGEGFEQRRWALSLRNRFSTMAPRSSSPCTNWSLSYQLSAITCFPRISKAAKGFPAHLLLHGLSWPAPQLFMPPFF